MLICREARRPRGAMGVRIGWDRGVDVRSASYQLHRSFVEFFGFFGSFTSLERAAASLKRSNTSGSTPLRISAALLPTSTARSGGYDRCRGSTRCRTGRLPSEAGGVHLDDASAAPFLP